MVSACWFVGCGVFDAVVVFGNVRWCVLCCLCFGVLVCVKGRSLFAAVCLRCVMFAVVCCVVCGSLFVVCCLWFGLSRLVFGMLCVVCLLCLVWPVTCGLFTVSKCSLLGVVFCMFAVLC